MAKSGNLVSQRSFSPIFNPCHTASKGKTFRFHSQFHTYNNSNVRVTITASTKRKGNFQSPLIGKNPSKSARRLITISPSDGKYNEEWTSDYLVSLRDLHLQDLIKGEDDPRKNAQVFINLFIQKHASFGLSVDATITTSFTSRCSNCSSPYCRQLDANFNVWVLRAASRDKRKTPLSEIGGDPYVIYTRPGYEVDLDSLVRDAIRLNSSVQDTCSELCAKSEGTILYSAGESEPSFDKRWSRLLELKKTIL
ncbi:unnamed protein product [Lathyrus oleraceus]|uniref:Uncharacterized protein n=1 Tax=Pisum sativum TaxID=3888 RepID=A0A9D4VR53_PEA|nr:large ribosomal RNA subunit accumulation protein YCED homolog 2, chloroplastic isoform X2 [Pisum sativum]KAI5388136.1 hypothetical protein KIW84_074002 [Pisum sativum]